MIAFPPTNLSIFPEEIWTAALKHCALAPLLQL